ncbi:MAG: hypothetical protein WCR87_07915, partial [Saccharofermentanales bacterium]
SNTKEFLNVSLTGNGILLIGALEGDDEGQVLRSQQLTTNRFAIDSPIDSRRMLSPAAFNNRFPTASRR